VRRLSKNVLWLRGVYRIVRNEVFRESNAMSQCLGRLVERQIQKALAEGKLQGLEGEGKPLPDRSGEAFSDMATAVAVRIMAEAGTLPEEFKIKKLLEAAKENYRAAKTEDEKHVAMALIAELEQRHNIAVEARRRFMAP
jgi:hypothetical protein